MWGAKTNPVISTHTFETSPFAAFPRDAIQIANSSSLLKFPRPYPSGYPQKSPQFVREQARARGAGFPVVALRGVRRASAQRGPNVREKRGKRVGQLHLTERDPKRPLAGCRRPPFECVNFCSPAVVCAM